MSCSFVVITCEMLRFKFFFLFSYKKQNFCFPKRLITRLVTEWTLYFSKLIVKVHIATAVSILNVFKFTLSVLIEAIYCCYIYRSVFLWLQEKILKFSVLQSTALKFQFCCSLWNLKMKIVLRITQKSLTNRLMHKF